MNARGFGFWDRNGGWPTHSNFNSRSLPPNRLPPRRAFRRVGTTDLDPLVTGHRQGSNLCDRRYRCRPTCIATRRRNSGTGAVTVIMIGESGDQCCSTKHRKRRCGCAKLHSQIAGPKPYRSVVPTRRKSRRGGSLGRGGGAGVKKTRICGLDPEPALISGLLDSSTGLTEPQPRYPVRELPRRGSSDVIPPAMPTCETRWEEWSLPSPTVG